MVILISKRLPDAVFLIMLRDPLYVCNSLKRYGSSGFKNIDIHQMATHYNELYLFLIEQIIKSEAEIFWMDFDRYVEGQYTRRLMDLVGLPTVSENYRIAGEVLGKKIRPAGDYKIVDPKKYAGHFAQKDESIFEIGRSINRIIKGYTQEL